MTDDDDDVPQDLRARRRQDTYREIHEAALDLFEAQGVRETTVQQIADRAGVSHRTFFRYFTSKEQAALPGQRRLLRAIEAFEVSGSTDLVSVLRDVERATEEAMVRDDVEMDAHRRITRLLAREPDLHALAALQEQLLVARLRARLTEQLDSQDATTVLLIAELAVTVWRTSWERWGELALDGEAGDPVEFYRRCREELRRIVG
jgi:AcrR family transcriptional regulator